MLEAYICTTQRIWAVFMVVCNLWMVTVAKKEELSCAVMECGQLSGISSGTTMMPEWYAGNWDTMINVRPHTIMLLSHASTFISVIL